MIANKCYIVCLLFVATNILMGIALYSLPDDLSCRQLNHPQKQCCIKNAAGIGCCIEGECDNNCWDYNTFTELCVGYSYYFQMFLLACELALGLLIITTCFNCVMP